MDEADHKNQIDEKEDVEVRALTFCVGVADSDFAMIKDLIHRYAHFQNVYIMLRDAAYRGAFPEKEIERFHKNEAFRRGKCQEEGKTFEPKAEPILDFSEESKTKHAWLLRSVSRPGVIRSLFQKRSPGAALKREETRLRNILAKDPKKHAKEIERKEKKAADGKANDSALADHVMTNFQDFKPLKNVLDAGIGLKSHVIFNLIKRVDSAYSNAFAKFEKTGRFCPPRTKRLEEIESFFVPLCTVSISKVGEGGLSINLSDRSVPVSLPLAATAQLQNKEPTSLSVGISHGKLCITVPYEKQKAVPNLVVKQKYAGLDLGIRYLATIFVDDDKTPSVCIPGGDAAKFNDRFNEKTKKLHGRYTLRCKKLKKMRTEEAKKRGVEYVKDVDMILCDAVYAAEAEQRGAEKAELDRLLFKRHEYFLNLMHKTARRILEHLKEAGVTKLFCSRNLGELKMVGSKMAKENRKRFHQIPTLKLLDYLKLNGAEYGIEVDHGVNEAYSSKISALKGADVLAANKRKKEELAEQAVKKEVSSNKESTGTNGVGVETKPQSGTIPRGGSRNGSRFIEKAPKGQKSRRSWHADVNGAANHITIGMDAPIKWNRRKIAKLCSPVVIKTSRLTWLSFGLIPGGLRPQARGLRHGARDPHLPNAEAV